MHLSELAGLRLHAQGMLVSRFKAPADAVRWLVAVQAQDYAGARWGVGMRVIAATDSSIERAYDDGKILRTHLLRPTWHFVVPEDIRWLLALTGPRVHAANASMCRKLELDTRVLRRVCTLLEKALRDREPMTRDEMRSVLTKARIAVDDGVRFSYCLMAAELDAVICSGPRRGKQFTYALVDERAGKGPVLARDDALSELTVRYFASRGPATVHDFAKWSGLTLKDARQGLESVSGSLDHERIDGADYWFSSRALTPDAASPSAHLLSIYDEYLSAYKDRRAMGTTEIGAKLEAMGNDLTSIVLVDGQVVGTWKRTIDSRRVTVELNLLTRVTRAKRRAVDEATERYAQFLQLPAAVTSRR